MFSLICSRVNLDLMKFYLMILTIVFFSIPLAHANELNPFSTDSCTMWSEGTSSKPDQWKHCCVEHDLFFWAGGTYKEREIADLELKKCIEATGAKTQARMMYWGVVIGKFSPIKFSDRKWGNAWPWWKNYQKLNREHIDLLLREAAQSQDISINLYEKFRLQLLSRQE